MRHVAGVSSYNYNHSFENQSLLRYSTLSASCQSAEDGAARLT